jgi:Site-specific recombinase XerD
MENEIEAFIRFLAVERGLSENYQLSTQRSLGEFAAWCLQRKTNHSRAGSRITLDQRIPGGTEARRALGIIDQVDRGRAQDFFSFRGRAGLRSARSDGFFIAPADRTLSAGDAE